jgi:two-component system, NarL family, sensor kinase
MSVAKNDLVAQSNNNLDSINTVLKSSKIDTTTINYFISLIENKFSNQITIQETIGNWVIKNAMSLKDKYTLAKGYSVMGHAYLEAFKGKEAVTSFLNSVKLCEENSYPYVHCNNLLSLSRYYRNNEQQKEAITYLEQAEAIAKKNNLVKILSNCKFNLSATLEGLDKNHNKDTLLRVVRLKKEAMELSINDSNILFINNLGLAETFSNYKYFDSSIIYLAYAKKYFTSQDSSMNLLKYLSISAKIYKEKATAENSIEDYKIAIIYNKKALELSVKLKTNWWTNHLLKGLAIEHDGIGDYKNAYKYMLQYTNLHDSLFEAQNFTIISEIKNKYEGQKNENEIIKLNAINKQKSTLNKIFIASTIGLCLLGFLGYRNFRSKQKVAKQQQALQQAKISELEKDKQLLAIDAMLQGQEEERSRIAKDLHDGLGGMLSGTKLSFMNMKENLIMDASNVSAFENSILQLDNTIAELRKVAHNLMPEALVKFGLKNAILDYCNALQLSSKTKIVYEQMGEDRALGNTTDLYIYRIIQELVNNSIKHASTNTILVQLTKTPQKVLITVEDDGKGFDKNILNQHAGIGMKSLQQRVDYLKGALEINSKPNEGTSIYIELKA